MATKTVKPQRTCVGCRKRYDQDQLLAVTRQKNGEVVVNPGHKIAGRSSYICSKPECLRKAKGKKGSNPIQYWLKVKVPDEVWEKLAELCHSEA